MRSTSGVGVMARGAVVESPETIERLRDLIIIRLTSRGMTQRSVGRVLNLTQGTVSKRLAVIPPEARAYHAGLPLGDVDEAGADRS